MITNWWNGQTRCGHKTPHWRRKQAHRHLWVLTCRTCGYVDMTLAIPRALEVAILREHGVEPTGQPKRGAKPRRPGATRR